MNSNKHRWHAQVAVLHVAIFALYFGNFVACVGAELPAGDIWKKLEPFFTPPAEFANDFGKYPSPLKFYDGRPVQSPADWQGRRAEILKTWHERLGPWPELLKSPKIDYLAKERRENVTQHQVHVEIAPGDKKAEGYLLVPDGPGPFPAVLVVFYEARTSVGLVEKARGTHDFGWQLAKRGFVTLSIGTPGSIEKPKADTRELLVNSAEESGRQPLSYLAYVAANCHTALANLPEVKPEKIGIVGLSYGGKWTMFASCLYDKFACAVWSDPGIVFDESNRNVNYYEPWYLGYEPGKHRKPGVPTADNPRTGLYKRLIDDGIDLNEIHALIAPRPILLSGGTEDRPQNWRALNHIVAINKLLGFSNRVAMTSRATHIPTPEAAEQTCLFFEYFLKEQSK